MKDDLTDRMAATFEANGMPVALKVSERATSTTSTTFTTLCKKAAADQGFSLLVHRLWELVRGHAILGQESN
jgi:hypothetical protein